MPQNIIALHERVQASATYIKTHVMARQGSQSCAAMARQEASILRVIADDLETYAKEQETKS